jgi:outer membrane protein OmpA-like peptidoglycan-associated protein
MSRPRHKVDENYIAFSDVMTCLMIIFLFIAISYIMEVFSANFKKDEIYNTITDQMINQLNRQNVKLGKDLSLKFINQGTNDSDVLFEFGSAEMTNSFKRKLDSIWVPYQNIITQDTFLNYISEIRIEGHTDTFPPRISKQNSFEYNLNLSSLRAQSVLHYVQNMDCYIKLDSRKKERLQFLMTANGMSYSRALNDSGQIAYSSKLKSINQSKSRRVEFRIVTTNEKLIQNLIKKE